MNITVTQSIVPNIENVRSHRTMVKEKCLVVGDKMLGLNIKKDI